LHILDNWPKLEEVLCDTYGPIAMSGSYGAECQYLKTAFEVTEDLWDRNIAEPV